MGVAFFIVAESVWAVKFSSPRGQAGDSPKTDSAAGQTRPPLPSRWFAGGICLDQPPEVFSNMPVQKLGQLGLADRAHDLVDHLAVLE